MNRATVKSDSKKKCTCKHYESLEADSPSLETLGTKNNHASTCNFIWQGSDTRNPMK